MSAHLPNLSSVVRAGSGRGFITEYRMKVLEIYKAKMKMKGIRPPSFRKRRLIVTAAHCLPGLPPPMRSSYASERTFPKLVASLDDRHEEIWTKCLFVDPIADIALLGCPDDQNEIEGLDSAYNSLTEQAGTIQISRPQSGTGWLLSLEGKWVPTKLEVLTTNEGIALKIGPTKTGMSGSPILNDTGNAIGIVAVGCDLTGQPILVDCLPGWFLRSPSS